MESYKNQNLELTATPNDQTGGWNEWGSATLNPTLGVASNYGTYPYLFGAPSFNWNGTIPYPSMAYGGHGSYCNTYQQQQQQPENMFYCSIPSPASSTTPSPAKQRENVTCSDNVYMVPTPFYSPPTEQIVTFSSKTSQSEGTSHHIVPYPYNSSDGTILQPLDGGPEPRTDLPLDGKANPTTVIETVSEWRCEQCNKQFVSKVGLKHHNKVLHTEERLFRCEKCGKRFTDFMRLHRHIQRHVTNNKPHKCEECPKTFNHQADLRRHQYRHTGDAPHKCSICSKAFARRDHKQSHELTHRKRAQSQTKRRNVLQN